MLYVENHLLLVESMICCMDNILVEQLTCHIYAKTCVFTLCVSNVPVQWNAGFVILLDADQNCFLNEFEHLLFLDMSCSYR